MSYPYEDALAGVAWKDRKNEETKEKEGEQDKTPVEGEKQDPDQGEVQRKEEGEGEVAGTENQSQRRPDTRAGGERKRRKPSSEQKDSKKEPHGKAASTTANNSPRHSVDEGTTKATSDGGEPGSARKGTSGPKSHNNIPLRKVQTVDPRKPSQPAGDGRKKDDSDADGEMDSDDEGHGSSTEQKKEKKAKKPFPKRLLQPKVDYQKLHEEELEKEREERKKKIAENGPRVSPPREKHEANKRVPPFRTDVVDVAWPSHLPELVDVSFVPAKPPEEIEKLVHHLTLPKREPTLKSAGHTKEPLRKADEELTAITERLAKQKKRYDLEAEEHPKYRIIQPHVVSEDDLQTIVERLSTPRSSRRSGYKPFTPKTTELPKLDPEKQKAVVERLFKKDPLGEREAKWQQVHPSGDGYSPSRERMLEEFDRKSPKHRREREPLALV